MNNKEINKPRLFISSVLKNIFPWNFVKDIYAEIKIDGERQTDKVSYRGALLLKNVKLKMQKMKHNVLWAINTYIHFDQSKPEIIKNIDDHLYEHPWIILSKKVYVPVFRGVNVLQYCNRKQNCQIENWFFLQYLENLKIYKLILNDEIVKMETNNF